MSDTPNDPNQWGDPTPPPVPPPGPPPGQSPPGGIQDQPDYGQPGAPPPGYQQPGQPPPQQPGYQQPNYQQPGYQQPAYGQPAYGQPQYGQPGYGYAPAGPKQDGMAIASLVSSVLGVLLICCWIGVAGCIAGAVMGFLSRKRIQESNGALTGEGLALAGIIVGGVGCALFLLWLILIVSGNGSYRYY